MQETNTQKSLTAEFIREAVRRRDYELSLHADDERLAQLLTIDQLETALLECEVIEDYPADPRGASCLVPGYCGKQPIHVVCGRTKQGQLFVITVYVPSRPKWLDARTRSPKELT